MVNPLARELVFKIVYYGPGLGGKTTTLQFIHAETRPEHRGKMVSLATPVDRTLYFDYLPIRVPDVRDLAVRLQLFTVPGQVYYNATRKLVLTGSDGVVFVADSQRLRAEANQESYDNLADNLREHGRELDEMPHVIQYNKRDLPDVLEFDELAKTVNRYGAPAFGTVATKGDGVFESLEAITKLVIKEFEKRVPDAGAPDLGRLELPEGGLAEALRRAEGDALPRTPTPMPPRFRPSGLHGLGLPKDTSGEVAARVLAADGARAEPVGGAPATGAEISHAAGSAARDASNSPGEALAEPTFELRRVAVAAPSSSVSERDSIQSTTGVPSALAGDAEPETGPPAASRERPLPDGVSAPPALSPSAEVTGLSFAAIWPDNERPTAVAVERALARGDAERVASGCELLISRALAAVAGVLGATTEAPRDPATVCLLLGLDGRRYLEFRAAARDIRNGRELPQRELLVLYAFAIDVRLARVRAVG